MKLLHTCKWSPTDIKSVKYSTDVNAQIGHGKYRGIVMIERCDCYKVRARLVGQSENGEVNVEWALRYIFNMTDGKVKDYMQKLSELGGR